MTLAQIVALAGLLCIVLGACGLLGFAPVPGVGLIVLGFIVLVVAWFSGRSVKL